MSHDPAARAYAVLAPFYDRFTAAHNHEPWADTVLAVARAHGLVGGRVLDAACGTGNSALPLVRRGFHVTGADLSPEMLAVARRRLGDGVLLVEADLRALPPLGRFDLVLAVGDVVNYLLGDDDLERAFRSLRATLAPDGLLVFDANTLGAYRTAFATDRVIEREDVVFAWRGLAAAETTPDGCADVAVEVFARVGEAWRRSTSRHRHRHHSPARVERAALTSGLVCRGVYGVTPDGRLHADPDELRHSKRLYVMGPGTRKGGGDAPAQEARRAGRAGRRVHEVQLAEPAPPGGAPGGARPDGRV